MKQKLKEIAQMETEKLLLPGAVLLGLIILTIGSVWAIHATAFRIGTVDRTAIIEKSDSLMAEYLTLKKEAQVLDARVKQAGGPTSELKIDIKLFTEKQKAFTEEIKKVIEKVARRKGVKAVTNPGAFIYNYKEVDLTEAVIEEFAKQK